MAKSARSKPFLSTEGPSPASCIDGQTIACAMLVKIVAAVRHVVYAEPFVGTGGVFFRRTGVPRGR